MMSINETKPKNLINDCICEVKNGLCPKCGADINYKKKDKDYCNCKNEKCNWNCKTPCK